MLFSYWLSGRSLLPTPDVRLAKRNFKEASQGGATLARQAFFEYEKTALSALEEVENSLASLRYNGEKDALLKKTEQLEIKKEELVKALHQEGFRDDFALLAAEKALLASQEAVLQSHIDLLLAYIALYKAL